LQKASLGSILPGKSSIWAKKIDMNKTILFFIVVASFLTNDVTASEARRNQAEAPLENSCISYERLENPEADCESNGVYVDQAMKCLGSLERLIATKAGVANLALAVREQSRNQGRRSTRQSVSQANAQQDHQLAVTVLESLILQAKMARTTIDSYRDQVIFPEEIFAPEELTGNNQDFLQSQLCYSEPSEMLKEMVEKIEKHIDDLGRARDLAQKNVRLNQDQQNNLNTTIDGNRIVNPQAPAASAPRRTPPKRESNVTGEQNLRPNKTSR
jgi:hypothetical protein